MAAQGQIVEVQGVVKAIAADGHIRILKSGDIVQAGERVELVDGASVLMMRPDGEMVTLDGGRTVLLSEEMLVPRSVDATDAKVEPLNAEAEQVIAALTNNADPFNTLEEAAAGLTGGGPDGGFSAYRLGRIVESISPLSMSGAVTDIASTNLPSALASTSTTAPAGTLTITLSSATNGQTVAEGGSITYTVSTDHAVTGSPLVVTLSNGSQISIPVGASSGSVTVGVRSDDAYSQGPVQQNVSISGTSGGNFEAVTTAGTVSNSVTDNGTVTNVTLSSATNGQAVAEGGSITYTVSTDHAVTGSPLVVTLSNGREVSIPVGASSGSVTVDVRSDDAYSQGAVQQNVSISGTSGGNFEAVTTAGTVSNSVTDNGTVTNVTLSSATNGQAVA
ncbi:retention module-containing protein, partial [Laribacter hongkongensis]